MMKNRFLTLLTTVCLALLISCNPDPEPDPNGNNPNDPNNPGDPNPTEQLVKKITEDYSYEVREYTYEYDEQNRVKKLNITITDPDDDTPQTRQFEYVYNENEILVKDLKRNETTTVGLNALGNALSFVYDELAYFFVYNAEQELVGIEITTDGGSADFTNTWTDGNMTNVTLAFGNETGNIDFEYGNIANSCSALPKTMNIFNFNEMIGYKFAILPMGKKNASLPTSILVTADDESISGSYTYVTDGDLVKKITLSAPGEDPIIIDFEY